VAIDVTVMLTSLHFVACTARYNQDLTKWADNYTTISVLAERGMTWRMFDNPYLAPKLAALGIKREMAFACALDYLVTFKPSVQQKFSQVYESLTPVTPQGGRVLRIGIQIRTGEEQAAINPACSQCAVTVPAQA
jgi:hypothetical protein